MERRFTLRLKSPYSNIEIIVCKELSLEIEAVPITGKTLPGNATFVMQWGKDIMHFNVLGDVVSTWSRELFEEAINWHVTKNLRREMVPLQGGGPDIPPSWFDSEDGFEQTEPWSEEERAWQQHISDDQRKYDVADRLANMVGQ